MGNELTPQSTLTITSSSRPKRVAFLINIEETSDSELNHIIRYNVGIWGGRFNAIIPFRNQEIVEPWWQTLIAIDPDIIYSFFPLEEKLLDRINRHILPYKIVEITPEDRERIRSSHYLINTFEIGALNIQHIPQYSWATRVSIRAPFFFYVKDCWEDTENVTFLLRNFGVLPGIVSMSEAFRELPHAIIEAQNSMPKECLIKFLGQSGNAVLPIDLCRMYAYPSYIPEYNNQVQGFHLVVGDAPLDVIYHWNRDLLIDSTWGRHGFWISKKMCADDDLLIQICKWIQSTWWSREQDKQGYVVSYSVDIEYLSDVAKKVSELLHTYFKPVKLEPDQFPTLKIHVTKKYNYRQTEQIPLSENKGLIGIQKPEFVQDGHPQEGWMVDLEIPFHPERYSTWTNARPLWLLPKRIGLSYIFFDPYRDARIISNGFVSCVVTISDQVIGIKIPSDREVFWMFLEDRYSNDERKEQRQGLSLRFYDMRTSDKGKYLRGIIQLFGNLFWCGSSFEDHFWREIFLYMAGRTKYDITQRCNKAHKVLEEFLDGKGAPILLTKESPDADDLAEIIARRISFRDPQPQVATKDFLISRFGQLRSQGLESQREAQWWHANRRYDEWKDRELNDLIGNQVLLMGAEITCHNCGSRLWYMVDDIKSKMRCNGCNSVFPLESEPKWSYRLNNLVQNALKRHGTLALLLALFRAQQFSSGMFLWLPCQEFYDKDNNSPVAEVDLMYMADCKFVIGEVKSDPSAFDDTDFEKLKMTAQRLRPHEVVIAAVCDTFPDKVLEQSVAMAQELKTLDVKVKTLTLGW